MEARNRTLPDWMTRIRTRQIMLPRFQRMEAWGYREITDLLEAVLRGLPVGSVLVLDVASSNLPFVSRAMAGAPVNGDPVTELLLDGQQRLTALWRVLHNDYEDRTYYIEMPDATNVEPEVISVSRWRKNGTRFPVWADQPATCWAKRLIPVSVLCPGDEGETEMHHWIQQVTKVPDGSDGTTKDALGRLHIQLLRDLFSLRQKVAQYNLPFLSLPVTTTKEVALDVFIKMNTRTVRLTTFDIIVAQTEEAAGESLHDLVQTLVNKVPNLDAYDAPEDLVLGAMALYQDKVPNQTGYLALDFKKMVQDWTVLEAGAKAMVEFLQGEGVYDKERLPTESVLAPILAAWMFAPTKPDARGNVRILLRKYLWHAFFTDRYERAAATAAQQDFRAIRDVITKNAPQASVPCFNEIVHPLPTKDELKQASWPKKRDRLGRAVLLVSLLGGAYDIADGILVSRDNIRQREYHHLFPEALLHDQGVDTEHIYRALNCALIGWRTNRTILAKQPVTYLRERAEASTLGENEIRSRLKTHAVNYDDLACGDYDLFLDHRATIIEQAVKELCSGKAWKPA